MSFERSTYSIFCDATMKLPETCPDAAGHRDNYKDGNQSNTHQPAATGVWCNKYCLMSTLPSLPPAPWAQDCWKAGKQGHGVEHTG